MILLNSHEYELGVTIASARHTTDRSLGLPETKMNDGQHWTDIEIPGALAEIAFAKYVNTYPDLDTSMPKPHDGRIILRSGQSYTYDVKSTNVESGHLLVKESKATDGKMSEIYVLMIGSSHEWRLAGWNYYFNIFVDRHLGNPLFPGCYALKQADLFKELPLPVKVKDAFVQQPWRNE